jgi:hypothetical protein
MIVSISRTDDHVRLLHALQRVNGVPQNIRLLHALKISASILDAAPHLSSQGEAGKRDFES